MVYAEQWYERMEYSQTLIYR